MRKVTPAEWIWVLVISGAILAMFTAPYIVAQRQSTSQMSFGGFVFGLEDMNSYLAKMRYGARDGWMLQLVYTSEPHRGGVVYPFYLGLGKLAAWISGEGAVVSADTLTRAYHAARLICGLFYLLVLYRSVAEYLEQLSQRRLAWSLAASAGGLGWIPLVSSLAWGSRDARLPIELYIPEGFSHLLLYGLPHLSLARALLLLGWVLLFESVERPAENLRWAVLAGAAWLGMALIVPFYVGLLGVLIGTWLGGLWLMQRRFPLREVRAGLAAGAFPLAILIYTIWVFNSDPVFGTWWAQNTLPSPPVIDYVLAYGLLVLLAVIGAPHVHRRRTPRSVLLPVWPLVAAMLVYSPINVQRRLLEGVIVPLCILAAAGIWAMVGQKSESAGIQWAWRLRQLGTGMVLMLLYPSLLLLLAGGVQTALRREWPIFHSEEELAALNWMQNHAPEDSVVLALDKTGNLIPVYASVRVYIGHGPETVDAARKREETEAFFHAAWSDDRRRRLIDEAGIDYVWVGSLERSGACAPDACFDATRVGLRRVFEQGDIVIYEVAR